jgi:hypothetical protein
MALRFVRELLETGLAMTGALGSLLEDLEGRDPWPGENPGEVLIDMAAGSVRPALRGTPADEVERAISLIVKARERFMADLRMAAEISARREGMRGEQRGRRRGTDGSRAGRGRRERR